MIVKVKRLHPDAVIPSYSKLGDAGLDLAAIDNGIMQIKNETEKGDASDFGPITRHAEYREYSCGLAIEIPEGYVGLVFPRSSISNTGLALANAVGVVDSGYRGEIKFRFRVLHDYPIRYKKGDRIGQIVILPYPQISLVEADQLSDSSRGTGGWGSSGV